MKPKATPENRAGPARGQPFDEAGSTPSQDLLPPGARASLPFGANLEPVLREACDNRLSPVSWFRTDWQRGGALTGYSTFRDPEGIDQPVVVNLPVPPVEHTWLLRLQPFEGLVPRLHAHGLGLAGYDIAWVVMERLPHGPLSSAWDGAQFDLLAEAAGRYYAASSTFPVDHEPPLRDWQAIVKRARDGVQRGQPPNQQRWKRALKKAGRRLDTWLERWEQRPKDHWCHGDLHLANAMTRQAAPQGPAVLIDFAVVHGGHWVEDAVYFEHLFWPRRQVLNGRNVCNLIAKQRKAQALIVDEAWPQLAAIRRCLLAAGAPAAPAASGDPLHMEAALQVLEATEV